MTTARPRSGKYESDGEKGRLYVEARVKRESDLLFGEGFLGLLAAFESCGACWRAG